MNDSRLIISLNAIQAERDGPYPFQHLGKEKQKYNISIAIPFPPGLDVSPLQGTWLRGGGGGGGGGGAQGEVHTSRLPYLAVPASISFFLASFL